MKTKSSKKILPATVFALIIVLSAFAVMCTTVSANGGKLDKILVPDEGGLGTVVNVTIDNVTVGAGENVTVVDTLPPELTYIVGTFTVNDTSATPTVEKRNISYIIEDPGDYTIKFDVKVTEASWEDREVENKVVVYNETDYEIGSATADFTILAFEDLYKEVVEAPDEIIIGQKAEWTLGMGVTNNFGYTMNATKIADRFGGDLMIDSINTTAGNYTFEYTNYEKKKQARVTIKNDTVTLYSSEPLTKGGVTIGAEPYEFHIFWTGRTHKAHFAWTIGPLASGANTGITIGVSTDTNPAGKQEYTSPGLHCLHELNSGATLKFIDPEDMQLSAVTDSIYVTVGQNILTNPDAETGDMSGWTIIANGGDGWKVDEYGSGPYEGTYSFRTSYEWCKRSQEVDLLAKGYTEAQLDTAPTVCAKEWFGQANPYCKGRYYLKVELRDEDHNAIASWDSGVHWTTWRGSGPASWDQLSHDFSGYGPGLRYIYWEDGGTDEKWWKWWYGAKLDAASLIVARS